MLNIYILLSPYGTFIKRGLLFIFTNIVSLWDSPFRDNILVDNKLRGNP
jgi:hypothetical protein